MNEYILPPDVHASRSPALKFKSEAYPAHWDGKVPYKVKMIKDALSHSPFMRSPGTIAKEGQEYFVYVNVGGQMAVILPNSEWIWLQEGDYEVIKFHVII